MAQDEMSKIAGPSQRRDHDPRRFWALDSLALDIRLGVRMLFKYPGLALVGTFGIAVAVAIASGGFSVIFGNYLSTSLPLEEGERLVSIETWDSAASKPERRILRDYHLWRDELKSIQEIGAFRRVTFNLMESGSRPQSVRVALISATGFSVARKRPLMGRYLTPDDERERAPSVVVIGESVWRNRFGSDPGILGKTIQFGAIPHSVVGVMPAGFAFPVNDSFWVPLRAGSSLPEPLTGPEVMVFGRLAPGATLETAQAELATLGRRATESLPKTYAQLRPLVLPYPRPFLGIHQAGDATALRLMTGIVTMLLVLVCLNVAILMFTRTAMRQGEIAVRTALGASRGRIVVQLFIEALVLSVVGSVAGVAIAEFALRQVAAATLSIASELPYWLSFHVSWGAVLYAGALSLLAAAIVGIVPALQATKRRLHSDSRVVGAGGSGIRLGTTWTVLIVAQVAVTVALLPGAIYASWENLRAELIDPGFAAAEFLTAHVSMDAFEGSVAPRYAALSSELLRRLKAEPGVSGATFSMALPGEERRASVETQQSSANISPGSSGHEVRFNRVDVDMFRTLGVPILAGRAFEQADSTAESSAIVVNESFAQRILGGDALGKRIRYTATRSGSTPQADEPGRWYEVVGVVKDFPAGVSTGMNDSPLRLYHPVAVGQLQPVNIAVHVRSGSPANFARRLSEIGAAVDPDLQLRNLVSLDEALHKEQWIRRLEAAVLSGIALSVLLLSSAGIYALMSFTVSQRRKEIGVRMALGANRTRIVVSIFSRALGQLAAGAVVGIVLAMAVEQMTGGDLTRGNLTAVLTAVASGITIVGILAALGPARRCLAIEPTEALREQ